MGKDAQIKLLRTTLIHQHGRFFDFVKKADAARIQDIRHRDMHIRALQQQNRNLNAQMNALKRHYAMNPHGSISGCNPDRSSVLSSALKVPSTVCLQPSLAPTLVRLLALPDV